MTVKNAMQLVRLVENQLGCVPVYRRSVPIYQGQVILAARFKREIAKKPNLYTFHNLELAVAYVRRKHHVLHSPIAIFSFVEVALESAVEEERLRPVGDLIDEAIRFETEVALPDSEAWLGRLTRTFGSYRKEVYDEWRLARGR